MMPSPITALKTRTLRAAQSLVRRTRVALPNGETVRHAMIVVPFAEGSLGDQAMVGGLSTALAARGCHRITLITYRAHEIWPGIAQPTRHLPLPGYFGYESRGDLLRLFWATRHADRFFVLGADVLDGFYNEEVSLRMIALTRLADAVNLPATIVGFSMNLAPRPSVLQALRAMPARVRICCRDPESLDRLQTADSRRFALTADVAFLLEPRVTTPEAEETCRWLTARQAEGHLVLGVNLNPQTAERKSDDNPHWIAEAFAGELALLAKQFPQLDLLVIPHDRRDPPLAEPFLAALPPSLRERVRVLPLLPASDVKAICGRLYAAVSGRMHLAIACLGQATPVITLEYQGKTQGLHRHFGTEELNTHADELTTRGQLAARLRELLQRRDEYQARLRRRLPAIRALALDNLASPWQGAQP